LHAVLVEVEVDDLKRPVGSARREVSTIPAIITERPSSAKGISQKIILRLSER
jgi:hypothetical protein